MKKPVILCVDDEESGLLVRSNILKLHGYEVLMARTGRAALELFTAQVIDAVVLDFCMPDLQGDTLANEMKRAKSHVPIILLTAYVSVPEQTTRLVDKVVVKAQHPSVLLAALSECMQERSNRTSRATA